MVLQVLKQSDHNAFMNWVCWVGLVNDLPNNTVQAMRSAMRWAAYMALLKQWPREQS
jgi:hypothetical protein